MEKFFFLLRSISTTLMQSQQYTSGQRGKLISMDQKGKLNIYIALDASDSINKTDFEMAKNVIHNLLDKVCWNKS